VLPTTHELASPTACHDVDVSFTNAATLAAAASSGERWPWLPRDPEAERLWSALGVARGAVADGAMVAAARRTRSIDRLARRWSARHPGGTIVEVGAGLSTRHARLADLDATFVTVDEPALAALRRSLFTSRPRRRVVAAELEDRAWCRRVVAVDRRVLTLIPDALVDLHPDDAVDLLLALAAELPAGSPIVVAHGSRTRLQVADATSRTPTLTVRAPSGRDGGATLRMPALRWCGATRRSRPDGLSVALLVTR